MTASTAVQIPGYVVGTWDIDASHSTVGFSVRHMMVSKVRGYFRDFTGEIVTAQDPAQSAEEREAYADWASRLSHAVSRLEERGWVRRQVCPEDGRGQLAVLTDEGFAALQGAARVHVEGVRTHLFDQLTPEQVTALRDIGETLMHHLRPTC